MKIIDILNLKANGELEDGFKFKYVDRTFKYYKTTDTIQDERDWQIGRHYILEKCLNNTVEVIEEQKEIEEINDTCYDVETMTNEEINYYHNLTRTRMNELIRAVNKINKEREVK